MLSAEETFRLIVDLASVGDGALFEVIAVQESAKISSAQVAAFRGLGQELQRLINEYRYVDSPSFLSSVQTKSKGVASMMRKVAEEPVRRKAHQKRFVEALRLLPETHDVFALTPEEHHGVLASAVAALEVARRNSEG